MNIAILILLAVIRYLIAVVGTWLVLWAFELDYNPWAVGIITFLAWNIIANMIKPEKTIDEKWNEIMGRKRR